MKPTTILAKRLLAAAGLALLAACSSNGPTDPTDAKRSGYLTISASVNSGTGSTSSGSKSLVPVSSPAPAPSSGKGKSSPTNGTNSISGYNVPAN